MDVPRVVLPTLASIAVVLIVIGSLLLLYRRKRVLTDDAFIEEEIRQTGSFMRYHTAEEFQTLIEARTGKIVYLWRVKHALARLEALKIVESEELVVEELKDGIYTAMPVTGYKLSAYDWIASS